EIGIGTWDSGAETLTRTVQRSSNSDAALNLPAGDKEVFCGVGEQSLEPLARIALSSGVVVVDATTEIGGNLVPGTGATHDVGLSGTRWRHGFLSGNLSANGTVTGKHLVATDTLTVNGELYVP